MSRINNFEELERETIQEFGPPPRRISKNVRSSMRIFQLVGNLIDLFFPKVLSLFMVLSPDHKEKDRAQNHSKPPNLRSE